jgi:hypothetical protein
MTGKVVEPLLPAAGFPVLRLARQPSAANPGPLREIEDPSRVLRLLALDVGGIEGLRPNAVLALEGKQLFLQRVDVCQQGLGIHRLTCRLPGSTTACSPGRRTELTLQHGGESLHPALLLTRDGLHGIEPLFQAEAGLGIAQAQDTGPVGQLE